MEILTVLNVKDGWTFLQIVPWYITLFSHGQYIIGIISRCVSLCVLCITKLTLN